MVPTHIGSQPFHPGIWDGGHVHKVPAPVVVVALAEQIALDHLFFEDIKGASSRAPLRGMWGGVAALAGIPPSVTE